MKEEEEEEEKAPEVFPPPAGRCLGVACGVRDWGSSGKQLPDIPHSARCLVRQWLHEASGCILHIFFVKVVLLLFTTEDLDIISLCPLPLAVARPSVHATVHGGTWKNLLTFFQVKQLDIIRSLRTRHSFVRCLARGVQEIWFTWEMTSGHFFHVPLVSGRHFRACFAWRSTLKLACSRRRLHKLFPYSVQMLVSTVDACVFGFFGR